MGIAGCGALLQQASRLEGGQKTEWSVSGVARRLKVPQKQKPRGRLWLNDGSCVRLRPTHRNHVWSDFVMARGRMTATAYGSINLIDEHHARKPAGATCATPMVIVTRSISAALADVMVVKGVPEHLRARTMGRSSSPKTYGTGWPTQGAKTLSAPSSPGSPWENGYCEKLQLEAQG